MSEKQVMTRLDKQQGAYTRPLHPSDGEWWGCTLQRFKGRKEGQKRELRSEATMEDLHNSGEE